MKELSVYKIRDLAVGSGRMVFTVQQLSNLIGKSRATATVYMSRLVRSGLAARLMQGKISFGSDDLITATQLVEPSYISLDSALLYHGIITQVPKEVECVTPKFSIVYGKLGIVYHKIPKGLFFGYKRYGRGGSYAFVADPLKALIDGIYLNRYSRADVKEYSKGLDFSALKGLVSRFDGRGSKKINSMIS